MTPTITNSNGLILLDAAKKLGITTKIINSKPFKINFIHQKKSHLIRAKSFNLNTSQKAKNIAKDKSLTLQTLALAGLPVPRHATLSSPHSYPDISLPFPQVIKPSTGEKGKHVFLDIKNKSQGQTAVNQTLKHYPSINIETYHTGNDYRFLLLNYKLIGLSKRLPPTITGDGKSTIKQLIDQENQKRFQANQQAGHRLLNRMRNWPRLEFNLHLQGLSLQDTPPQEKTITLYPVPNFSTGGSVTTINPQTIHPSLVNLAQKASKIIGLELTGIDMLIKNLHSPATPKNVVIIELNSDPGIRLHDWPNQGQPQHVAEKILESIFLS